VVYLSLDSHPKKIEPGKAISAMDPKQEKWLISLPPCLDSITTKKLPIAIDRFGQV
jgi:hypothetical protein